MAREMKTEYAPSAKFDTHSVIKSLIKAGVEEPQAEAIVTAINNRQDHDAVTKLDLMEVKSELNSNIANIEKRLSVEIERAKYDMVKWQIGTIIALSSIMIACFKFFGH